MISVAERRAEMPAGANQVLDRRSLENNHSGLIPFLKSGTTVLDVGCGSGAISKGIAERVYPGKVVGIDVSGALIEQAAKRCAGIENISFKTASVFDFDPVDKFDVVTAARTLQWLSNPGMALEKMAALARYNGIVSILDYNHEKIEWNPSPPASMIHFYKSFLEWRQDAGMSNQIADELQTLFSKVGLTNISVEDASEVSIRDSGIFIEEISIWGKVAETRGQQMVVDQYITEAERLQAMEDYREWVERDAVSMKLYLRCVTGEKNRG